MDAESPDKILVGVVMGSRNDYAVMRAVVEMLQEFGVAHEVRVVSAHRTPDLLFEYAESAVGRGLRVIIAGAGGAAHLPGMIAAKTVVPVLGVPIPATSLQGLDSLLSIVQMPKGVPVGTLAIGASGAMNAGLLAVAILATTDTPLQKKLEAWRAARRDEVLAQVIGEDEVGA
jgi:5-(carboxyamino)imidazole ribonucleotide mutase